MTSTPINDNGNNIKMKIIKMVVNQKKEQMEEETRTRV